MVDWKLLQLLVTTNMVKMVVQRTNGCLSREQPKAKIKNGDKLWQRRSQGKPTTEIKKGDKLGRQRGSHKCATNRRFRKSANLDIDQ